MNRSHRSGQASTEIALLMPLFLMLVAGAGAIAYMCWQGIKVQQAANYAARIQGQERVAGGVSAASIYGVNGVAPGRRIGDEDPMDSLNKLTTKEERVKKLKNRLNQDTPESGSIYGKYYQVVRKMFGKGEQDALYIPPPVLGVKTDRVKVSRVVNFPEVFGLKMEPVILEGKAYGGEDSFMYGLPRWGKTANNQGNNDLFWKSQIKQ